MAYMVQEGDKNYPSSQDERNRRKTRQGNRWSNSHEHKAMFLSEEEIGVKTAHRIEKGGEKYRRR